MMICRKIDGKVKYYKLSFWDGINLQNSGEGSIIYPNYEYWAPIFGENEETRYGRDWGEITDEYDAFFENHWVKTGLFHRTIDVCNDLGFAMHHAHNLVIPLSDFDRADKTMLGTDIRDVARDVKKLKDLFIELEDPYKHAISITVEVGRVKGIDTRNGWYHFTDQRKVSSDVPRAIEPFIKGIQRLIKTDVELNKHIHGDVYQDFENQSLDKHYWQMKNLRGVILYEYLKNHELMKSKRDGYIKTGKFMAILDNDYLIDSKTFEKNSQEYPEYKSYDYYLADIMGQRIRRYYTYKKSVTENS